MAMILTLKHCDPSETQIGEVQADKTNPDLPPKRRFNLEQFSISYINGNYCIVQNGEWEQLQDGDFLQIGKLVYQVCINKQEEQSAKLTPNTAVQEESSQTADIIQVAVNEKIASPLTRKDNNKQQPIFIDDALLPSKLPADPLGFLQPGSALQQAVPTSQPVSLSTQKLQTTAVTPQLLTPLNRQYSAPRVMPVNQFRQTQQPYTDQQLPLSSTAANSQNGNIMQDLEQVQHVLTNTPNYLHDLSTRTQMQNLLSQHPQENLPRQCYDNNEQQRPPIQTYDTKKRKGNFLKRLGLI